ncbi:MAG: ABC transporter ATP-binding protein [Lachnospiraceae bacterium]
MKPIKSSKQEELHQNILEVSHLQVSYKKNTEEQDPACQDISFEIQEGEIVGLLGESGCGKSTLAKAILGIVTPTSGEVRHYSSYPQMIFQDPYSSLNPTKTVGWILQEPFRIQKRYSKAERKERAIKMLYKVGLSEQYMERYPRQLSGGQRQRVCIGAALMLEPRLLIADEPVSALDVTIQAQIMQLLLELHSQMGLAILFISHDLRVVYQMSDRVMIMQQGRLVEQGSTQELYANPQHPYTGALLEAANLR